jgi:hypothetical protein
MYFMGICTLIIGTDSLGGIDSAVELISPEESFLDRELIMKKYGRTYVYWIYNY